MPTKLLIASALLKSHIGTYTRQDGTVVQAHEDKRQKHSPEQMAKWAEEKRQREAAQIAGNERERVESAQRARRNAEAISQAAFGNEFTPDESEAIRGYYLSGDRHGAQAEGRNAAVNAIERRLRSDGVELEHVGESQAGKSKSLYVKIGDDIVRVSDHELPTTAERQANHEAGRRGRWSREVIVSDWQRTSLSDYITQIRGDEPLSKDSTMAKSHRAASAHLLISKSLAKALLWAD